MAYVQGFLAAVPKDSKEKYKAMAEEAWPMFRDRGALSMVENWGVDIPDGKVTSFPMATKMEEGETVIFSWIVWPDKATCDKASKEMEAEFDASAMDDMPFDGMRMMWGGFEPLLEVGT